MIVDLYLEAMVSIFYKMTLYQFVRPLGAYFSPQTGPPVNEIKSTGVQSNFTDGKCRETMVFQTSVVVAVCE